MVEYDAKLKSILPDSYAIIAIGEKRVESSEEIKLIHQPTKSFDNNDEGTYHSENTESHDSFEYLLEIKYMQTKNFDAHPEHGENVCNIMKEMIDGTYV